MVLFKVETQVNTSTSKKIQQSLVYLRCYVPRPTAKKQHHINFIILRVIFTFINPLCTVNNIPLYFIINSAHDCTYMPVAGNFTIKNNCAIIKLYDRDGYFREYPIIFVIQYSGSIFLFLFFEALGFFYFKTNPAMLHSHQSHH